MNSKNHVVELHTRGAAIIPNCATSNDADFVETDQIFDIPNISRTEHDSIGIWIIFK